MGEIKCAFLLVFSLVMHKISGTPGNKRLVLHSDVDMATAIRTLTTKLEAMSTEMAQLTTQNHQLVSEVQTLKAKLTSQNSQLVSEIQALKSGAVLMTDEIAQIKQLNIHMSTQMTDGSVYTRWGRTTCLPNGTELVYSGYTAGNYWNDNGAADYICLAGDPLWAVFNDATQQYTPKISGAEYDFGWQYSDGGSQFFGKNIQDHDAPCAVCRSSRSTSVMIPGRNQCFPGWTMEYWGYLVSGDGADKSPTNYACLDARPEWEVGDVMNQGGKEIYLVEATCGSLKCPPYVQNREITCVVCSK